jgi:hypothetical protein
MVIGTGSGVSYMHVLELLLPEDVKMRKSGKGAGVAEKIKIKQDVKK